MSTTIDQKVVEMRFDNSHFEKNVSGTMSTLDKLKQKLNLSGASKGLENINTAANKVNMNGLSKGVETVTAKFSALQVVGVTALSNLTNSAMNYAKNIARSLTIAPISDGFQEYEMTLNAVQTTMAATGKTAKEVEVELKKLDEYADKTVYGTADMLNNLPKFTNAGVELESATKAMIGIANATALAGGDAGKASIAFYNLGQAIGTGYLTRMDYNSINNAGIATMEWKKQMVEAAIAQGTLTKVGEDAYKAGNKTLTLQQLFIDGLQEQWATTDVMMKVFGDYGDETTEIGKKAYASAQDIKTYSMMMESLKATAGTGWKDTWQIIFGDLDAAKKFWTGLTNTISGVITKMADIRNFFLDAVLNFTSPWTNITDKLGNVKKAVETVENFTDKLEYFQNVVNDVWRGDYKNSDTGRFELLEKAGYDHRVVQDLVNKGHQYQITVEDIEASHKKFGLTMETTTEQTKEITKSINGLTEEQLKEAGLTEYEIQLYKDLQREAERTGKSVSELADEMSKTSGRTLLINSFKNIGGGLVSIFKAIGQAWREIFDPISIVGVYNMLKSFKNMTLSLKRSLGVFDETTGEFVRLSENGENLKRTFKGIFAVVDILTTLFGGGLKIAFKLITSILSYFNLDILDVTASVGDALVKFRDWIDSVLDFEKVLDKIMPPISNVVGKISEWVEANVDFEKSFVIVSSAIESGAKSVKEWFNSLKGKSPKEVADIIVGGFETAVEKIGELISYLKDSFIDKISGAGTDFSLGFVEGIWNGVKFVAQVVYELGRTALEKLMSVLDEHSPSKETKEIGVNFVQGFIDGIAEWASKAWGKIKEFGEKCIDVFNNIDFGGILAFGVSAGLVTGIIKFANAINTVLSPLEGVGDLLSGVGKVLDKSAKPIAKVIKNSAKVVKSFAGVLNSFSMSIKAKALKDIAIAIAILVGAIALLTYLDVGKVILSAVVIIGVVASMAVLMNYIGKTGENGDIKIAKFVALLWSLAGAITLLAIVVKILAGMEWSEMGKAAVGLVGLLGVMAILMLITKIGNSKKIGTMLIQMAGAMLALTLVAKMLSDMTWAEMGKAAAGLGGLLAVMAILMLITRIGNGKKIGTMLIQMAVAIGILAIVAKMLGDMEWSELGKAAVGLGGLLGVIAILMLITKIGNSKKIGAMLLQMAGAMAILAITAKILASMEWSEMGKAGVGLVGLAGIITGLIAATRLAGGNELKKVATTLIAMAFAIGILAVVATVLGLLSPKHLAKGIIAVGVLAAIMALMIAATKNANDCKDNLIVLTVAIAVMAGAVAALSLIDGTKLAGATIAMFSLIGILSLLVYVAGHAKSNIMGPLIVLTVAIALLAGAVYALAKLPVQSVLGSALAMSTLLLALSASVAILSKFAGTKNALVGVLALTAMFVPLKLFVNILASMQSINDAMSNTKILILLAGAMSLLLIPLSLIGKHGQNVITGVIALTILSAALLAFVGVMAVMQNIKVAMSNVSALIVLTAAMSLLLIPLALVGKAGTSALFGVLALTAIALPLVTFVCILALMQNVKNATDNAIALSILATALTLMLIPLSLVGVIMSATGGLAAFGIVALLAMAIPLLAFVGILAIMQNINNATDNVNLIIKLMTAMTGMLVVLAIVGPLALIGVAAMAALTGLMVGIGALAAAVGVIMQKFPELESFIDTGLPILEKLAGGIGLIVGKLIGGFMSGIAEGLPKIALQLSAFMVGIQPFIMGAKMINKNVLTGVGVLTAAILLLTAADLINGIASFLQGGSSFARLGTELSMFMINALPFIAAASLLNETMMNGVKALAETILILTAANVLEGLTSWLTGGNSLGTFAQQLPLLGSGIAGFINAVGTIDESKVTTAANAAKIIKELASAASEIPNTGGLLGSLVGDNDMGAWALQLPLLGTGITGFINAVGEIGEDQVGIANTAAEIIKVLASAAQEIPNTGGLLASIVGDNDLSTFAENLPDVGEGIAGFIEQVGEIDSGTTETAKCAADIISTLATVSQEIPNAGGLLATIVGDNDLSTFADSLSDLGEGISEFMDEVEDFNEDDVESIKAAVSSIKAITSLADADLENISDNIDVFGDKLEDFGSAVSDFCEELAAVDSSSMTTAINNVNEISSMARNLNDLDSSGAREFKKAVETIGKTAFDKFTEALSGATASVDATDAAKSMIENAITGVKSKKESFNKALKSLVSDGIGVIKTQTNYDKFLAAGAYLVDGFAAGIRENTYKAEAKAAAMANAAEAAAKAALAINSPSKVFRKIGYSVPEGFAMGIDRMSGLVQNSVTGMADGAIKNVSRSISRIGDAVNADIDSQPTIRPVLDLSDVRSGASAISGLFNEKTLVGVRANVSSINRSMNDNLQNGGNSDIISAINKLRKDLGNVGNTTYQINGITYDDGSALQDAFGTIVRQARIERRV